ncbi:GAF and ANTAR domain-containing protein [Amycolatopsis sp. NBC_00355]|uniref:GAF and ANTAR domain-containing protein n=1 Tax=Amycolatopsis sp. NBC_00355 TaxID=2975957 RepID=UPI002E270ADE
MAELDALRTSVLAALADGTPGSGVDTVGRVCRAFVRLLPVDGAAVSVMADAGHREVVYTSDPVSAELAELQLTLGEGPCYEAYSLGGPVLHPDLVGALPPAWPVFAAQAVAHPVAALFTFPLQIGVVRVATLDTYRATPGSLTTVELATALQVADIAALALSGLLGGDRWLDGDGRWMESAGMRHREVHQATGMLIAQLDVPAAEALAKMRAHAFGHGRTLLDVAADIVAGRLRLDLEP